MKKALIFMGIMALLASGCGNADCETADGTLGTVKIGDYEYKTTVINCQTMMAENMRSSAADTTNGIYAPGGREENVATYGHLYTWEAALKVCPNGWHLPSKKEFSQLLRYVKRNAKTENVWQALVAKETTWTNISNQGTDEFAFAALPAGYYDASLAGNYGGFGSGAYFWAATEEDSEFAYRLSLYSMVNDMSYYGVHDVDSDDKTFGQSVRCFKDEE